MHGELVTLGAGGNVGKVTRAAPGNNTPTTWNPAGTSGPCCLYNTFVGTHQQPPHDQKGISQACYIVEITILVWNPWFTLNHRRDVVFNVGHCWQILYSCRCALSICSETHKTDCVWLWKLLEDLLWLGLEATETERSKQISLDREIKTASCAAFSWKLRIPDWCGDHQERMCHCFGLFLSTAFVTHRAPSPMWGLLASSTVGLYLSTITHSSWCLSLHPYPVTCFLNSLDCQIRFNRLLNNVSCLQGFYG